MTEIIQVDADHITITETCLTCEDGPWSEIRAPGESYTCPDCNDRPRSAVIVMDGEEPENVNSAGEPIDPSEPRNDLPGWDEWDPDTGPFLTVPEQVRRLTEPCDGCNGTGWFTPPADDHGGQVCLRLCHDGKPTFTLHQRCCYNITTCRDPSRPGCCWGNDGSGVIDLGDGWIIRDVLPIVEVHDLEWWTNELQPGEIRRVIQTNGTITSLIEYTDHSGESIMGITLPSAARPGQYAILCEQATS